MQRTLFAWLAIVVVFALMLWAGYGVAGSFAGHAPVDGWCCIASKKTCERRPSLETCDHDGGSVFDLSRTTCMMVCSDSF